MFVVYLPKAVVIFREFQRAEVGVPKVEECNGITEIKNGCHLNLFMLECVSNAQFTWTVLFRPRNHYKFF